MEEECCGWDVLEGLDLDSSTCVFGCLDEPADLVRAAAVSHSWRRFVLENDNRILVCLNGAFYSTTKPSMDCIKHCIGASSTDNFPDESMENTLEPHDRVTHRPSYWSSGGQVNPDVPESLTYKLKSDIFIIDGIRVQPFKAYSQPGHPIYSSKTVRIRMVVPRILNCQSRLSRTRMRTRWQSLTKSMSGNTLRQSSLCCSVCHAQVIGRSFSPEKVFRA